MEGFPIWDGRTFTGLGGITPHVQEPPPQLNSSHPFFTFSSHTEHTLIITCLLRRSSVLVFWCDNTHLGSKEGDLGRFKFGILFPSSQEYTEGRGDPTKLHTYLPT